MIVTWLRDCLELQGSQTVTALVWRNQSMTYTALAASVDALASALAKEGVAEGDIVAVIADVSPTAIALVVALHELRAVAVPLAPATAEKHPEFAGTAGAAWVVSLSADDHMEVRATGAHSENLLVAALRARSHAGLVIFSSGSTGVAKASLLDLDHLLERFKKRGKSQRCVSFLLFDHIGGLNTIFAAITAGGTLVTPGGRDVDSVCQAIDRAKAEVLPTSPTFLRMMLMSDAQKRHDLSSLKLITYGTEPMHEATLRALHEAFPNAQLKQTYGLTELGIFRTQSRSSESLWVKVGGEGVETRVVDSILQIRAKSAMLGYLNAPSPFDADGWYSTGDRVSVDGEYLLIHGRESEIINVGGEKVYPAEVESVLMLLQNVADATVSGKKNAVTGQVVTAQVTLREAEDLGGFSRRARAHCARLLAGYKVPVVFSIVDNLAPTERFKKSRRALTGQGSEEGS